MLNASTAPRWGSGLSTSIRAPAGQHAHSFLHDLACPLLSEPLLASTLTPSSTIWLVHVYQRALLASMLTPSSMQTCGSHLLPLAASFLHFLPDLSLEFWAVGVFLGWVLIKTQLWRPWVSPGHRDGMRPSIPSSNTLKRLNNGHLFLWGILAPRAIKSGVAQQLLGASSSEWGDQLSPETSKWYMVGAKLQIEGYWYFFLGCVLNCFSHVQFLATLWTVAHQAPLSMAFSRKESWSGFPFPPPGDVPNPGTEPSSLTSPALAGRFFTTNAICEAFLRVGQLNDLNQKVQWQPNNEFTGGEKRHKCLWNKQSEQCWVEPFLFADYSVENITNLQG